MNKTLNAIIWVFVGFFIALFIFKSCGKDVPAPIIISPKQIAKDEVKAEAPFKIKYDSLFIEQQKLQASTAELKTKLATERKSRMMAESELNIAINKLPDSLQKDVHAKADELSEFIVETDSSCDSVARHLEKQLQVKDNMLDAKDSLYSVLKNSYNVLFHNNEKLIDYTGNLNKKIGRQKAGNIIWKTLAAVAAGLLIKQSIK